MGSHPFDDARRIVDRRMYGRRSGLSSTASPVNARLTSWSYGIGLRDMSQALGRCQIDISSLSDRSVRYLQQQQNRRIECHSFEREDRLSISTGADT